MAAQSVEVEAESAMSSLLTGLNALEPGYRILVIVLIAVAAHLLVVLIRRLGARVLADPAHRERRKFQSVVSLSTSTLVFLLYFAGIGFLLNETGVPIAAYLASASIIGLAVGFGSQGLVQDVVSGLTTIFSDLFDVGDMVEITGQAGIVRSIGLRFVEIQNSLGARVVVPNRSITSVITYPRGYVRCIADVTLSADGDQHAGMVQTVTAIAQGVFEQFPGILLTPPSIEGQAATPSGRHYLRIKFRIWPNRGQPIEVTFKQEVVNTLKNLDENYQDWMVAVYYEVEQQPARRS